jgi:4-aminobutyrate aminotransferase/(S)-3-amino-2-methylpropionate transaminase
MNHGMKSPASRLMHPTSQMQKEYQVIGDVRGLGAMAAMELVEDPETKKPAGDLAKAFRSKLYENGVVNIGAGTYHNVIRILVPLTIEDSTLARGLDIMEETMAQVAKGVNWDTAG